MQDQIGQTRRPALAKALADLEAGGSPGFPFNSELGGIADALLGIAEALQQERGSARAVLYARLALYLKPDLAEGQILIGDTLAGQENLEAAIDAYDAIDPQSPLGAAAKIRKAQTLHEKEDKDAAFKLLEEIADADPKKTEALIELGNLLRRDEQYKRAEEAYSRAIERWRSRGRSTGPSSTPVAFRSSGPSAGRRLKQTFSMLWSCSPSSPSS